jgi:hypothetical protein
MPETFDSIACRKYSGSYSSEQLMRHLKEPIEPSVGDTVTAGWRLPATAGLPF